MPVFQNSAPSPTQTNYENLNELAASAPVDDPRHTERNDSEITHHDSRSRQSRAHVMTLAAEPSNEYNIPDQYANLNELGASSPVENVDEERQYRAEFLEDTRSHEQEYGHEVERQQSRRLSNAANNQRPVAILETSSSESKDDVPRRGRVSKFKTALFTLSYLVLFSVLGTLARLGIEALTTYPGYPVTATALWANFSGSMFMGFLSEDRKLFQNHHPNSKSNDDAEKRNRQPIAGDNGDSEAEKEAAKKAHMAIKKTIPLYIGLTTGFCGSLTSFSTFMRDVFLELSNSAHFIHGPYFPRNGGYNFMALLAVIITTVCLSLSALQLGGHLAIATERFTPGLPRFLTRKVFDRCAVVLGWGLWLGAIVMAIWPPDRPGGSAASGPTTWSQETWRGQVIFGVVFAPLGTLIRFYAAIYMNGVFATFPLGTFVVNVLGCIVLGMAWDLNHAPLNSSLQSVGGGIVGCQVLQGIQDGFCGCLTTVSTWVLELTSLKRRHAYLYGLMSILLPLAFLVVIMGTLQWTQGFSEPSCSI